jgi:DNA-binding transcriptional ArsR family regulator
MRDVSLIEGMKVEIPEDIKKEVDEKGGFNLIKNSVPMGDIQRLEGIIGVLADKKRLLIIYALSRQRMCVCMLADITQSPYSKCSYHITRLKDMGIITAQSEGNYLIYSLTPYGKNILKILERLKEVIE